MIFKNDVLTIGSATLDTFLEVEIAKSKIKVGDKVLVKNVIKHSGGSGTNSAAVLAKLNLKVKMLTKLGNDPEGKFILEEMKQYKVKNICLHNSSKHTDISTIIDYGFDRTIYVHKGASAQLNINDYKKSQLNTKWIYLGSLIDNSFNVCLDVANYVKKNNTKLLFNPSLYLTKKGVDYLKPILEQTTILIFNHEEAEALLRTKQPVIKILKRLQQLGPEIVVITNGNKNIYALEKNNYYTLTPPKIDVKHTAGAGDTFAATLLGALIKKKDFSTALQMAQANSCSVIQHIGTKNKLLNEEEIFKMIKKHKIKVKKK
jgi:ribokinase